MEKSDKNNGEMLQQLIIAAAGITKSMKSFEYQNDTLRKENAELKGGVEGGSKNDLAAIKAKDNIIANLQKEVSDLKNNRAEAAREMNVLTDQVNLLKSAAKGEKCSPPIKKSIPHSFSIKFDDFSDNL